ncbi:hypothetical protein B0H16DRAFT_1638537 [Mycena metata]|uniref:Uncharacterized protein n=1 Tax=Mycena metata TaxID=1033252 RepID=A0AAD7GRN1_9AGAR|nr:hypothetical protein B0H16DRAFT_1638537 [Mycena metata]
MIFAPEKTLPPLLPFRPRQRVAGMPPIARWNLRAAKFLAIRASQPPLTSRAACARHRLDRKQADLHHALTRRVEQLQKEIFDQNTFIDTLHTISLSLAAISVIQDAARASSLCRTLCAAFTAHAIPGPSILPFDLASALLEALDASTRPLVDPDGFSVD